MNAHVKPDATQIARQQSLPELVAQYEKQAQAIAAGLKACKVAQGELESIVTIAGVYGQTSLNFKLPDERELQAHLLKSAWLHCYAGCNIATLSSPTDKRLWDQQLEKLPHFTLENIRELFGKFLIDPRGNMLRGLAEVFCGLDQAFKSHDLMKIGVKGLPKRVVLSGCSDHSSYGRDKVKSIINALAAYQGKPLAESREIDALWSDENALLVRGELAPHRYDRQGVVLTTPGRGIRLRRFGNGNGHMFFEKDTLVDVNKALAEFYGEVLPDTPDENPTKAKSTAVSKDLQFYWTPEKAIEETLQWVYHLEGAKVLEPSCGDGRFMDALRKRKADVFGIEVDAGRTAICRAKGHRVLHANFLETVPDPIYDWIIMNPPFYGKHWIKHVVHAFKFLKPEGKLKAILPITARDVSDLFDQIGIPKPVERYGDGPFRDLPVGSFSETGTNINTTVLTIQKPK